MQRPTADYHQNPFARLSVDSGPDSHRDLSLRLSRRLDPQLAPQMSSSERASGQFAACAAPWTLQLPWRIRFQLTPKPASSRLAVDAFFGLRRRLHPLACQRSVSGFRRGLILQPTVCFNPWLAPQTDSSGVPSMRRPACAGSCIFWLLQLTAPDLHRLLPPGCPAILLSDFRRSLYPPVMPTN